MSPYLYAADLKPIAAVTIRVLAISNKKKGTAHTLGIVCHSHGRKEATAGTEAYVRCAWNFQIQNRLYAYQRLADGRLGATKTKTCANLAP